MMGVHDSKSFKSGNSVAVRFPRGTGLQANVPLTITPRDGGYWVAPKIDPAEGKRRLHQMIAALDALPKASELWEREEFEMTDRDWS